MGQVKEMHQLSFSDKNTVFVNARPSERSFSRPWMISSLGANGFQSLNRIIREANVDTRQWA